MAATNRLNACNTAVAYRPLPHRNVLIPTNSSQTEARKFSGLLVK